MAAVIRMPAALAGVTEGAIQTWLVQPGDSIAVGAQLAEIETEKAVVEYPSEVGGTVARLLVEAGQNVAVGTPIAVVLAAGEGDDAVGPALAAAGMTAEPEAAPAAEAAEAPAPAPAPAVETPAGDRLFASPIVRRLARERGIELAALSGSGPDGRIVRRDLDGVQAAPVAAPVSAPVAGSTDIPLTGMRRAIARRLTESKTTVPHFYVTAHCNVGELLELRRRVNESGGVKVSVNDFVLKAVAGALRAVPEANAIWGGDVIRRFDTVDLAVAVAVEGGLLTPVLRGVDSLTLTQIATAVADAAGRARAGKLRQEELEGGSFSVSNLGMYGVDEFSAILNPPQSGILAVGAAKQRPVVVDGQLAVGTVMTVTLSADHRVINGAVAAQWMAKFVALIENPVAILA